MDWFPNINFTLSSWDAALVVHAYIIYRLVGIEQKISRTNIRIALVYFLGPTLIATVALRLFLVGWEAFN